MIICHVCLNGPYNEGWNYQENILPKYHVKQGNEVHQIVTPYMWEGTKQVESKDKEYINDAGVHIIRATPKKGLFGGTRFNRYPEVAGLLNDINPGVIFIHDVQCLDMKVVANYLKNHPRCVAYADNHSDFSNSARNWISKNVLHGVIWKHMAHTIEPYVKKFYGVLPARVDFLENIYKLPHDKVELLVMGADDELVDKANENKLLVRKEIGVSSDDFLIMTGGKIDLFKTQTLLLMEAVQKIASSRIKLVVFGSVAPELKDKVELLADGNKVKYIGWINADKSYDYFAASDLVVFPGRHSVFWEQVAGQGIPMIVKYWDGTTHVDCGGNVKFLYEDSAEEIKKAICECVQGYQEMKRAALNNRDQFLYSNIAKKSIEG